MSTLDVTKLTVTSASHAIWAKKLSPLELTEAYLARIERLNGKVNAYVTVTAERAREEARRATEDIAAGRYRGPLHGIPIAHKDLFATAGVRTTAGSKIFANHVPKADSTVVRRLSEAGAVLLGKLNTHEFAYGVTTDNPHFGKTRNPWDLDRSPGGSSGGSGAAIVAGLALATTGTDPGGSIRIPSSVCGCVGLKPTYGRVSKAGVFPLSYFFDHPGPITHSVEDAALLLQAMAGYDPDDAASVRAPVDDYLKELRGGVKGLRVGVPRRYFYDRLDDEVRAALEAAIRTFGELGATVVDVEIPGVEEVILPLFAIVQAEALDIHAESLAKRRSDIGADVLALLDQPVPTSIDLARGLRASYLLVEKMRRALEGVDVLVTATTPIPAVRFGQETVLLGGREDPTIFAMIVCTAPFNATRLPALSLPCGFTKSSLPIGLQIVGRPFDEATVLRTGASYEQATGWHLQRPKLDA